MWSPLGLEERLQALPMAATVKGMFLSNIADLVEQRSGERPGRQRYVGFKSYPLREMIELLPQAAELTYPGLPAREGIGGSGGSRTRRFPARQSAAW